MTKLKHTSIRMPANLWRRLKDLSAHIKKKTGKNIGIAALIVEALYFYFDYLYSLEKEDLILKHILETKAKHKNPYKKRVYPDS